MCVFEDLIASIHHKFHWCFVCIDGVQHIALSFLLLCCCEFANQRIPLVTDRYLLLCTLWFRSWNILQRCLRTHTFEFHHPTASDAAMRMADNRFPDTMDLCGHLLAIVDKSYSILFIKLQKSPLAFTRFIVCAHGLCILCMSDGFFLLLSAS